MRGLPLAFRYKLIVELCREAALKVCGAIEREDATKPAL